MKKIILYTLLMLFGATQALANDYEYVPFVREGVKWVYDYDYDGDTPATLELKGDTIINGKTYKAMHYYCGQSINTGNDTVPVYLREEDKVVYGIVPDGQTYAECPVICLAAPRLINCCILVRNSSCMTSTTRSNTIMKSKIQTGCIIN